MRSLCGHKSLSGDSQGKRLLIQTITDGGGQALCFGAEESCWAWNFYMVDVPPMTKENAVRVPVLYRICGKEAWINKLLIKTHIQFTSIPGYHPDLKPLKCDSRVLFRRKIQSLR